MKQLIATAFIVLVGAGYWHFKDWNTFPPVGNTCFDQLIFNIESAHIDTSLTVPDFAMEDVTLVRCSMVPGFIAFEFAGTDALGQPFHLYETTGGKAASGGDSVFDYCYMRDTEVVSQTRITGRAGKVSSSKCEYTPYYTETKNEKYEFSK